MRTSEAFWGRKEFEMGAGTLNWCALLVPIVVTWRRWCVDVRARLQRRELSRLSRNLQVLAGSKETRINIWSLMGFYPGNIFSVELYHEMLGPGVSMGSYPFSFGIKSFLESMRKPIFLVAGDQVSISRCEPCIVPKKIVNVFCLPTKILWETQLFFRSFKSVISSTNSGSHWLSRKCRTYTFKLRRSQDQFLRPKIEPFFWRDFSGEEFREKHYCPTTLFPLIGCGVDSFSPN